MNSRMNVRGWVVKLQTRASQSTVVVACCVLGIAAATFGARAAWLAYGSPGNGPPQMAMMLPQGALLTIEAKDFSALLKHWNGSPEKTAWLKSDNYSVFSNSRLFGRLGGAQDEFAATAGLPPDESFLKEVAGRESIFAWYDIGNLEFLYITRMPSSVAEKTRLLKLRSKFSTRQVGDKTFYVRTQGDAEKGEQQRTVAFATSGDWLLLATRDDLIAGALTLMSNADHASETNSLAAEPWFADAWSAAKTQGDLRMTLNLEKIVPTPYFRSYWVQQNITEMKQWRGALADLFLGADSFHEERVLLPKSPGEPAATPDLAELTALLPLHTGVYRAVASPAVDDAVATLNEKLLRRTTGGAARSIVAPSALLNMQNVGSASDLETRIDAAPLTGTPRAGAELDALREVLSRSELQSMMTVSRTGQAVDGIWVPFQSAVVFSAAKDWDLAALQAALQRALGDRLTTSSLGLEWKSAGAVYSIGDVRPMELAVKGRLCILSDNDALLQEMLAGHPKSDAANASQATLIAGLDLTGERANFVRWTGLVDRLVDRRDAGGTSVSKSHDVPAADVLAGDTPADDPGSAAGVEPSFFSQNMRSLTDVFAALDKESLVESRTGALTRQTVIYTWHH